MDKKIPTIPFGAEIPPELAEAFFHRVATQGWMKKRALAAAVRAFVTADDATCARWYAETYKPVPPPDDSAAPPAPKKPRRKSGGR